MLGIVEASFLGLGELFAKTWIDEVESEACDVRMFLNFNAWFLRLQKKPLLVILMCDWSTRTEIIR